MGMIVYLTGAVIIDMRNDDQQYRRNEQPVVVFHKKLLQHQENKTGIEKGHGQQTVMVFSEAMPEWICADYQGQPDHSDFKSKVVNDIDTEQGKTAEKQRKEGTMNGTGQWGPDP